MRNTFFILLILLTIQAISQQKVLLLDGRTFTGNNIYVHEDTETLSFDNKKGKHKVFSLELIYSYENKIDGTTKVVYKPEEGDMNAEQILRFIAGEQKARKSYSAKKYFWYSVAIGSGTGVAFWSMRVPVLSILGPATYTGIVGYQIMPDSKLPLTKLEMEDPFFVRGYKTIANQKNMRATLKGGTVGYIVGIAASNLIKYACLFVL